MSPVVTKSSPTLVPPASPTRPRRSSSPSPPSIAPPTRASPSNSSRSSPAAAAAAPSPPSERVAAIREGFARALVPYFPVAGRIIESVPGEPMVECSGDGIWFMEAEVDCALDDVNQHARSGRCSRLEALGRLRPAELHPRVRGLRNGVMVHAGRCTQRRRAGTRERCGCFFFVVMV
uniref:Uncharacterized protein n=1 Tax=Ananas comosus var. bracteatus TaxID=296719 RepID=A0A6V7Q6K8_ANACO|nr:unnamed protein product [Ananas comosus var. bracteatus]